MATQTVIVPPQPLTSCPFPPVTAVAITGCVEDADVTTVVPAAGEGLVCSRAASQPASVPCLRPSVAPSFKLPPPDSEETGRPAADGDADTAYGCVARGVAAAGCNAARACVG